MIGKRSKDKQSSRNPRLGYQRSNSYHYSAKRSSADRLFDRGNESEQRATTKRVRFQTLPAILSTLVVVAGVFYLSTLSSSAQITIQGKQDLLRNQSAYESTINAKLDDSLLNRSKFTINKDHVASEIEKAVPEFANVSVSTPLMRHRPRVIVTMAQPAAVLSSGEGLYLLDEQGRALFDIKKNKPSFDISKLPLVQDQSSHKVELDKPALTADQVDYVYEIRKQADAQKLQIDSMVLPVGGGELDVRFKDKSFYVKFNIFEDARKSSGTLFATLDQINKDGTKPAEYIDVRIPDRAYVK